MSITEQLCMLETRLEALHQKHQALQQENRGLQTDKQSLQRRCEELIKKNEIARAKVTQLLNQLTSMETEHV